MVHMENIKTCSERLQEHIENMKLLFSKLRKTQLILIPKILNGVKKTEEPKQKQNIILYYRKIYLNAIRRINEI